MTVTPLGENVYARSLGNGVFEIIVASNDEPKIIDGRSDRTRRMDREIEAWYARQAWAEAVKKYDKAF